ncbi:hypothetical protein [Streptomyces sp. YIM S03343]
MREPAGRVPLVSAVCGGAWRLAALLAARLRTPHPAPRPLSRPAQVRALLSVLDEAVVVQRPADAAVAACGEPGPVSTRTAQDGRLASSAVHRLRCRLRDLQLTEPDLTEIQAHAGRLLAYDQWMLRQSQNLAFTTRPGVRTEAARLQFNGLGRPADDLRRLRDALWAAEGGQASPGVRPAR